MEASGIPHPEVENVQKAAWFRHVNFEQAAAPDRRRRRSPAGPRPAVDVEMNVEEGEIPEGENDATRQEGGPSASDHAPSPIRLDTPVRASPPPAEPVASTGTARRRRRSPSASFGSYQPQSSFERGPVDAIRSIEENLRFLKRSLARSVRGIRGEGQREVDSHRTRAEELSAQIAELRRERDEARGAAEQERRRCEEERKRREEETRELNGEIARLREESAKRMEEAEKRREDEVRDAITTVSGGLTMVWAAVQLYMCPDMSSDLLQEMLNFAKGEYERLGPDCTTSILHDLVADRYDSRVYPPS